MKLVLKYEEAMANRPGLEALGLWPKAPLAPTYELHIELRSMVLDELKLEGGASAASATAVHP